MRPQIVIGTVAGLLAATAVLAPPPMTATEPEAVQASYTPPVGEDFSSLTWTGAFRALLDKMGGEYAFTRWKGLDFAALRDDYLPRVRAAQQTGDRQAYYLTLRDYFQEFRDGHVSLKPQDDVVLRRMAGGGFGMTVAPLHNGGVSVTWTQSGGPARRAGVRPDARILNWDGVAVSRALRHTDTTLAPSMPTDWRVQWERSRFMVRTKIGQQRSVTFRNPGAARARTVDLTAVDDDLLTLDRTSMASVIAKGEWPTRMVEQRVLPSGYGYIRVYAEIDMPAQMPGDHTPTLTLFRRAVRDLQDTPGLIVDVRGNAGGSDQMVADFMASFMTHKHFYEYQNYRYPGTGRFGIFVADDVTGEYRDPGTGVVIRPGAPRYRAPVVALVDNATISSGEGVALGIGEMGNGRVVGFSGTNGSFGMSGDAALMPGGYEVDWPFGQSLDQDKIVQVDSRIGVGGVMPDDPIPATAHSAGRYARGHDVVLHRGVRTLAGLTSNG